MESISRGRLSFELVVDHDRSALVEEKLVAYNKALAARWEDNNDDCLSPEPLQIFVKDSTGQAVGGPTGRTHGIRDWLEISVLWVDDTLRGFGIGAELITRAEAEGLRRGCKYARSSSADYQAPEFYRKLGYTEYGLLENSPPGDTSYYFRKDLGLT